MRDEVYNKAITFISDPDIIVNLFDFSVVWLSPKAQEMSGVSGEDVASGKIRLIDVFGFKENEARDIVFKDIEEVGFREFQAKMKDDNKYQIRIEFNAFEFKGEHYRVGKIAKAEKLDSD